MQKKEEWKLQTAPRKTQGKVPIRQHSSGREAMQQAASTSLPPAHTTPEEYIRSVKEAITSVRAIEEDVKLQYMFFWVLSGLLFTTAFIVPDKLDGMMNSNTLLMSSVDDKKKVLDENRRSLEILKEKHSELEKDLKKIQVSALTPPPAPASSASPVSARGFKSIDEPST